MSNIQYLSVHVHTIINQGKGVSKLLKYLTCTVETETSELHFYLWIIENDLLATINMTVYVRYFILKIILEKMNHSHSQLQVISAN